MPYELRLPPTVQHSIREYVKRFEGDSQLRALDAIQEGLNRLAANPRLGRIPGGAFGRPVYVFRFSVDGVNYTVRVAYSYSEDETAIIISGFEQQLF